MCSNINFYEAIISLYYFNHIIMANREKIGYIFIMSLRLNGTSKGEQCKQKG